eukprot:CAMPEP_0170542840 /NCGR_PEP_ID=MMETSP0211-20121228/2145_1 /TAXON_ID=311385 /ORGANISM="Pseudokeronopsis sp., Strain OXSARD2" /LENGTH=44 /DNA_ID= /DNA_START= /DNA_END= /DNA_ORIENTATION=
MSHQIIEKLEKQIIEYKYELDEAKSTIEKQHEMYNEVVRSSKAD